MTTAAGASPIAPPSQREVRKVVVSSFIGTALEWYDFFLFGTTTTLVFAPLFFPGKTPLMATLLSFIAFGIGFLARPLGAVLFGHFGDRLGRRNTLVATVALMGLATTLMGVLPDYRTAGFAAPVLLTLLRTVQGIATGGEWGGATLMALEYAPRAKRGLYASLVQLGSPAGNLLSTGAVTLMGVLAGKSFLTWGWRVPYLLSIILIVVALFIRTSLRETPTFDRIAAEHQVERVPVAELLRTSWLRVLVGMLTYLFGIAGFFVMTTFAISYVTTTLKLPKTVVLNGMLLGAVTEAIVLVLAGLAANRVGANRVVIWGYVVATITAVPFWLLVATRQTALIYVAYLVCFALGCIPYGPVGAMMNKLFPARLNYSGLAVAANLAGMISGFMPFLAEWLLSLAKTSVAAPIGVTAVLGLLSLAGAIAADRIIKADERAGLHPEEASGAGPRAEAAGPVVG